MADDDDKVKSLHEALDEIREIMREASEKNDKDCEEFWNNATEEDRLKMFYCVVKRIHKAEMEDRGSYRWALYDVFGFGPEAYGLGMECGYMNIHNAIYTPDEIEEIKKKAANNEGKLSE